MKPTGPDITRSKSPAVVLQMAKQNSVILDEAPKQSDSRLGMWVDDKQLDKFKSQCLNRETGVAQINYELGKKSLQNSSECLNLNSLTPSSNNLSPGGSIASCEIIVS